MKLTILAVGSRGDVQPCVALGRGLSQAGYTVRVVTMQNFEPLVRQQGLGFWPIEGDAQALTRTLLEQQGQRGVPNLLRMWRGIMRSFGAISKSYRKAFSAEVLRDSDAILSQLPGGFFGYDLAERLGIPYVALSVIPQETTAAWPMSMLPNRTSLGPRYNRLTYALAQQLAWQPLRSPINEFRRGLGLPPASFWWGNMRRMVRERVPVIQGFSRHVVPTPPDWGEHVYTTGYWILEEDQWQPPAELQAFLEAGDPPIFIGFGSMPLHEPGETTDLILAALAETGQRGVLLSGWAGLGKRRLPPTVYGLDYAPYRWLFPRMAAVVHHGGSGTTGLALRSGAPSLVIPFSADQPFWGRRTEALGAGPAPVPFSKLSTASLSNAIRTMTRDVRMQRRAQQLRQAMLDEDGVGVAVDIIGQYLGNP